MSAILTEITIIILLLLANGVFAMTELAVVSARRGRLKRMAEGGDSRARAALELAESPNRFLSTVQVGITLIGVLAGAFGGATVAEKIDQALQGVPWLAPYGEAVGIGVVVVGITYLSLILGELVPKRLALDHPEAIARVMAPPISRLAAVANPLVRVLGYSTDLVLRLFGTRNPGQPRVSEEEVKVLLEEGTQAGVFNRTESLMVERVLALDQLPVREIMTPRPKIIWINKEDPHDAIWHKIVVSNHSHFPVYEGNRDNVVGILSVKSIYANLAAGTAARTADLLVKPLVVPSVQNTGQLLETFKQTGHHIALVTDEFGGITGLVTLHDAMEAIVGDFPSQDERAKPAIKPREDGSWLIDAIVEIEEVERGLPGFRAGEGAGHEYQTLAGYLVKELGRIPHEGDTVETQGYLFEILDMDHLRIDKVLAVPANAPRRPPSPPTLAATREPCRE